MPAGDFPPHSILLCRGAFNLGRGRVGTQG